MDNIGAKVRLTSHQAAVLGAWDSFVWQAADFENGSAAWWDVANPTRLVAPASGFYLCCVNAPHGSSITAITYHRILLNGTTPIYRFSRVGRLSWFEYSYLAPIYLSAGDYIELQYYSTVAKGPLAINLVLPYDLSGSSMAIQKIDDPTEDIICLLGHSADQAVASGVRTALQFDTEVYDPEGMHNPADNTKITIPSSGTWLVFGKAAYLNGALGDCRNSILLNGSDEIGVNFETNGAPIQYRESVVCINELNAADYVELVTTSATTSTDTSSGIDPVFGAVKLSAAG